MTRVAGLAEIVLWVRDIDAALEFYRDRLGLEVISPPEFANKFLKVADAVDGVPEMIVLIPHPDQEFVFPPQRQKRTLHHLAFRVGHGAYDGLENRFIEAGLEVRHGVHPVLKGVRTFYVDDPDGNECECITYDPDHPDATKTGYELPEV
ncbi:MAG TPA: VOC family protein [Candidatus Dormibacteraeota bacterium]|jgi:catechol 2,3-dioxygenase-like lactoylglutathione lyase family enzyme